MTREQLIEVIARAAEPGRWQVMDAALDDMRRKYKGQNVGWPADQFKDAPSMEKAILILNALTAAGMVMVPKKDVAEWSECLDAMARGAGGWAWEEVLDEMRATMEAANG